MTDEEKKEALKTLRKSRKQTIDAVRERMKETRSVRKQLSEALSDGPKTVPELAAATGIPIPFVAAFYMKIYTIT